MPAKRNIGFRKRPPTEAQARSALSFNTLLQIVALPFILLLLMAIVWIALNIPLLNQYRVTRLERDQQQDVVGRLDEDVAQLEKTESQFQDGLAIEQVLRERYRMVKSDNSGKPSEQLIQIEYEDVSEK